MPIYYYNIEYICIYILLKLIRDLIWINRLFIFSMFLISFLRYSFSNKNKSDQKLTMHGASSPRLTMHLAGGVLNNIIRRYTMPLSLERKSLITQKSSEQNVTHVVYPYWNPYSSNKLNLTLITKWQAPTEH